jgi:AraC-like DNA-binding protein
LGDSFKVLLILLIIGVFSTSFSLLLSYKKSIVTLYYSLFQLCLFGTVFSALASLNSFEFLSVGLENAFTLLFYVLIITIAPTLYNFVGFVVKKDFIKHSKIYSLSFLILSVNVISFLYLTFGNDKGDYFYEIIENVMNYSNFISFLFIFPIITTYYLIKTSVLIFQSKRYPNSNVINEIETKSILLLVIAYFAFIVLFLIAQIFKNNVLINYSFYAVIIGLIIISYMITFQLFKKNKIQASKNELIEDFSYFNQIEEGLNQFIILDKNYLNPRLTLNDCAKGIKSNEKYLSNYLNKVMNMNFNTYINNLRIEEAKGLLLSTDSDRYTIEAIAKMAGFNSKSSFNAVFKKHVGMTPSEFKSKNK